MPRSELPYVVKSGLKRGHAVSDPSPIHRAPTVFLRYSRTGGAKYVGAPSCCRLQVDSRRSCLKHVQICRVIFLSKCMDQLSDL
jgi:hypothetical protein